MMDQSAVSEIRFNRFKDKLARGIPQIGLWCSLASSYSAEAVAGSGFDWLMFDSEHSPNEVSDLLPQLQAVAPYDCSAVVRPAWNDPVLIKRCLDLGAQTLLVPFVQNTDDARRAVMSVEYPPAGWRGVSALTRATNFGRAREYVPRCRDQLCLLVQVETMQALEALDAIASVEGIDGFFFGPADLAASMGLAGNSASSAVVDAVLDGICRVVALGKPAGVLTGNVAFADECLAAGATFVAVGVDLGLLTAAADALANRFATKRASPPGGAPASNPAATCN